MTIDVSAKCGFLPPTAEHPERPAVFVVLPFKKETANYARFEIPFPGRETTAFSGQVYMTRTEHEHLGAPLRGVRVTIEPLYGDES